MGEICSKILIDFFNRIKNPDLEIEKLNERIGEAFPIIAKAMHIGRYTESFNSPESMLNINGTNKTINLYLSADGTGDRPLTCSYITGENGTVEMIFFPEKDYAWSADEAEQINFIADTIYTLQAKARLTGLMRLFSVTDMSTGASNMQGFVMHCEKLRAMGIFDQYTVMFLNLKNFKFINKIAGERQGDEVLKNYTQKLLSYAVGEEKIARPGGDNFVVLIKKEREDDFLNFISKISYALDLADGRQIINISARVGIFPVNSGDTVNTVTDGASAALNKAKKNGIHDVVRFGSEILEQALRANEISNVFPTALRNKEFAVYYQPKVNLADNKLCGCEALTRWIRDGKTVSPAEFIPVLENEGSICSLDFYVLETVCSDIRRWIDDGMDPVRVSTNFSKLHLNNANLAEDIISVIQKYGIESRYIEIELTESSGYDDYNALEEFVRKMREYGVSTSIDDFGTGYSSLNMLKDLDVDIIKLDKSFLDNLDNNKNDDEVVIRHIINMVNDLEMKVVAEGVETHRQAEMLDSINCSMAQGYLFDKPLPCDEFEKRLSGKRVYTTN